MEILKALPQEIQREVLKFAPSHPCADMIRNAKIQNPGEEIVLMHPHEKYQLTFLLDGRTVKYKGKWYKDPKYFSVGRRGASWWNGQFFFVGV